MVYKLTRKLDSYAEHVFFQKLRSKKILIRWEPEKTDIKDNLLLFLVCGFTNWVIPPKMKQTAVSDSTLFYLAVGIQPDLCPLAPDSVDDFHSNVCQHPDIPVIVAKMHHLVVPSFTAGSAC